MYVDVKVRLCDKEPVFGPGLMILLEEIGYTGSMKEACARMGMSYSKGWKIVNRAEEALGYELIIRHHGGTKGGKCSVTDKGKSMMERYEKMEHEIRANAELLFLQQFPEFKKNKRNKDKK